MLWSLRWRRRTAGIALFAILLNALAPAITHARAAFDLSPDPASAARLQLCTAAGLVVALLPAGQDAPSDARADAQPAGDQDDHRIVHDGSCPFCGTHAGSFLLFNTRPIWVPPRPPQPTQRALPSLPDLHLTWPAHHSRGPPAA